MERLEEPTKIDRPIRSGSSFVSLARMAPSRSVALPPVGSAAKFVVGIGASAGGLDSLERFFRALPPDTGAAYVVVQHLAADHKSVMEELLSRFTPMPVANAVDGAELAPDRVHVLSPGTEIEIRDGRLAVFRRSSDQSLAFPIDRMLLSLAEARGSHAVAVVLSGSGSDGSRGVRRVDAVGGLVLVEDPLGAAFDGMPRAAIEAGAVDAALDPEAIAQAVADHVGTGAMPEGPEIQRIDAILGLLDSRLGVDFADYKRGTIYRRVARRAKLLDAGDLERYAERLGNDEAELRTLHGDLLIGVTAFFRDAPAFAALASEIGRAVASPIEPERELRAWVAGCATGEEAFSIAILLDEALRAAGTGRPFKIFATDVDVAALDAAGRAIYPAERLEHVSAERLERYFVARADGGRQVAPALRNHVVFAQHDLLHDTPFTNLDLVSCRNLLIYFKPEAQRRALASLAYGLRVDGVLLLGGSETPGELAPHFEPVEEAAKLYRKRVHTRGMHRPEMPTRLAGRPPSRETPRSESRLLPLYDALLDRFMPPSFLVDRRRELVDSYGDAERYLRVGRRRPSRDFLDLVPESARLAVAGALAHAERVDGPATFDFVAWNRSGEDEKRVRLRVERIALRHLGNGGHAGQGEPAFLLSVEEPDVPEEPVEPATGAEEARSLRHFRHLEDELAAARLNLQATVEELEASNEELQATNEELLASNEELQSVNEELHSVNEELHTVNAEHQMKIGELTELNRDIGHLLESIDVATVYLDAELRIRKFTPAAARLFGLVEHDTGRLLASFNHKLHYPTLDDDVRAVRDGASRIETDARGRDGRWYFVRLLPYRVAEAIEGVVVTVTDATALADARERARELSAIVESTGDAVLGLDFDGTVTTWNAAATRLYGYAAEEMLGESVMRLVPESEQEAMRDMLARVSRGAHLVNVETRRVTRSGGVLDVAKTISPVLDAHGVPIGLATIDRDIRAQKDLERRLRESEARYEDLYRHSPEPLLALDMKDETIVALNEAFVRATGYAREAALGRRVRELFENGEDAAGDRILAAIRDGDPVTDAPLRLRRGDGETIDVAWSASAVFAPDGTVTGARVVLRDETDRRRAEADLARAARMREQFVAMVSHELRSPLQAIHAAFQVLDSPAADETQRERSNRVVRRQTRQMIRLVDDLLDVSRILHGKLQIERSPLDFAEVARAAFDAVAPAFREKGVRLVTDGFEIALPMFGDAGRLEQVLANLLGNSLRFTPEGRKVEARCRREGGFCRIEVVDEGRGIAAGEMKSIFDMFAQSRQGLARSEGGLGLGLSIAERIVAAHGGSIDASSDGEGRGATMTIVLALDERAAPAEPAKPVLGGKLSVLVVEDQEDARETLRILLSLDGHDVSVAANADEALRRLDHDSPRVGLFDIGLPGRNGYELAREVRRRKGDRMKLIAMSGYGQPEDVRAAHDAGFDRHLTKPVDPDRLSAALHEVGAAG